MPYQNVGKPRIFVDYLLYNQAIGNMGAWLNYHPASPINNFLNPLKPFLKQIGLVHFGPMEICFTCIILPQGKIWGMNYSGFLGHNFGAIPIKTCNFMV